MNSSKFKYILVILLLGMPVVFSLSSIQGDSVLPPSQSCFDTGEIKTATETSQTCTGESVTTINPGFEENTVPSGTYKKFNEDLVNGWNTTDSTGYIEMWGINGPKGTKFKPHSGSNYVELNSSNDASLYQDVEVSGGETITFEFYHHARFTTGEEGTKVVIGYPDPNAENNNSTQPVLGDPIFTENYLVTYDEGWVQHTGVVTLPESDSPYVIRLAVSISKSPTPAKGNLLDDIKFSTEAVYDEEITVTDNNPSDNNYYNKTYTVDTDFVHMSGDVAGTVTAEANVPSYVTLDESSIKVYEQAGTIIREIPPENYTVEVVDNKIKFTPKVSQSLNDLRLTYDVTLKPEYAEPNNLIPNDELFDINIDFYSALSEENGEQTTPDYIYDKVDSPIIDQRPTLNGKNSEVDIAMAPTDQDFLLNAIDINAMDYNGVDDITDTLVVSDIGGYDYDNPQTGTYTITIEEITGSNGLKSEGGTFTLVVSENATINGNNESVDIHDAPSTTQEIIDLMQISATDYDGTSLDFDIETSYDPNNPAPGVYEVKVTTTGSNKNEITETFTLSISDQVDLRVIDPFTIGLDEAPTDDMSLLIASGAVAVDYDGTQIPLDNFEIVDKGGYDYENPEVGSYEITIKVTGKNNEPVQKTITMNVVTPSGIFTVSDYATDIKTAPKSDSEIIDVMVSQATDINGEDISSQVTILDYGNYDLSNPQVGQFPILFELKDSADNSFKKSAFLKVTAVDATLSATDFTVNLDEAPQTATELKALSNIVVIDGDDKDISSKVTIVCVDGYNPNTPKAGYYTITYQVEGINRFFVN